MNKHWESKLRVCLQFCVSVVLATLFFSSGAYSAEAGVGSQATMTQQYLSVIPALILILMVIVALALLIKRYNPNLARSTVNLKVIASTSLGGKERMVLVQAGNEVLLLGVGPGRVQTLHKLEGDSIFQEADSASPNPGAGFAQLLQQFSKKY